MEGRSRFSLLVANLWGLIVSFSTEVNEGHAVGNVPKLSFFVYSPESLKYTNWMHSSLCSQFLWLTDLSSSSYLPECSLKVSFCFLPCKNIRRALLALTTGPSSPGAHFLQWPSLEGQ